MNKKTIKDIDLAGKRVFIRVDFNVPISDGKIEDDTRIRGAVPTIEYAIEKGAKIEPNHPMIRIFNSSILFYRGDTVEAIEMMENVLREHPEMDGIRSLYAIYLANTGKRDEARAQLTEAARGLAKADHDMAYWMTSANAQLGEIDEAFYWMERAIKLGNENRPWYENDKMLEPLRKDPRFQEALSKIEGII